MIEIQKQKLINTNLLFEAEGIKDFLKKVNTIYEQYEDYRYNKNNSGSKILMLPKYATRNLIRIGYSIFSSITLFLFYFMVSGLPPICLFIAILHAITTLIVEYLRLKYLNKTIQYKNRTEIIEFRKLYNMFYFDQEKNEDDALYSNFDSNIKFLDLVNNSYIITYTIFLIFGLYINFSLLPVSFWSDIGNYVQIIQNIAFFLYCITINIQIKVESRNRFHIILRNIMIICLFLSFYILICREYSLLYSTYIIVRVAHMYVNCIYHLRSIRFTTNKMRTLVLVFIAPLVCFEFIASKEILTQVSNTIVAEQK